MEIVTEENSKRMIVFIIISQFLCCVQGDIGYWPMLMIESELFSWYSNESLLNNIFSKLIFVGQFLLVFALFSRKLRSICIIGILGISMLAIGVLKVQSNYSSIDSFERISSIPFAISVLLFVITALVYLSKRNSKV